MLQQRFSQLIKQPQQIETSQLTELEVLIKEYPFFETAHLLYLKGLHKYQAINYSKQLRKTAIIANSRSILHELIYSKEIAVKKQETVIETKTANELPLSIAEQVNEEIKVEPIAELPVKVNPVTVTNPDVKVIYINTVTVSAPTSPIINKNSPLNPNVDVENKDIAILKDIENETESIIDEVIQNSSNEQKLNNQIDSEIKRSVIQSYVEKELIKTPELDKKEVFEPLSFTDWLNKVKNESHTIQKGEETKVKKEENQPVIEKKSTYFNQNKGIIDKIIESDPGRIKLGNQKFFTPTLDAKQSLLENEHLVTETLAKIYALQGNNSKAIRAYEILSLKFPQKSVYFATLIEKLKTNK